jgi:iron complex transport system ATP-binding protein
VPVPATDSPLLAAEAVSYQVGERWLVDEVSCSVAPGELVAVAGPNGAGKSTLLKLLSGDLPPAAGVVRLDGRALSAWSARDLARRRAVFPQQTLLQFAFTARDVVAMGRHAHHGQCSPADDAAIVDAALEQADAAHLSRRVYPTLSGGEQARVTLARVLAQQAAVLLLDEPTAALDIRHQQLVMRHARALAASGAAVLAILHDLNLAVAFADRLLLMAHARLVFDGPPASLSGAVLSAAFETDLDIHPHPVTGRPLILPV